MSLLKRLTGAGPVLALAAWLCLIVYPLIQIRDYLDRQDIDLYVAVWQYAALLISTALVAASRPGAVFRSATATVGTPYGLALLGMAAAVAASSALWSLDPIRSLRYVAAIVVALVVLGAFWRISPDERRRAFATTAALLCAFIPIALVYHGGVQDRWIGGVHPNTAGQIMCAATVLAWMAGRRLGYAVALFALAVTVAVSSRTSIGFVAILLFVVGGIDAYRRQRLLTIMCASLALPTVGLLLLASEGGNQAIESVTAINDPLRGTGTGFTGRAELWSAGWATFLEHPVAGVGFRVARSELVNSAHNGVLEVLIDNGALGFLILAAVPILGLMKLARARRATARWGPRAPFTEQWIAGLALLLFLPFAFFEPIFFSLGNPFGVVFLLLLAQPLLEASRGRNLSVAGRDRSRPSAGEGPEPDWHARRPAPAGELLDSAGR